MLENVHAIITERRPAHVLPALRTVRVAIAGCGSVGGALLQLLRQHNDSIRAADGVHFDVVRVLVRDATRGRPVVLPPGILTTDVTSFLATDAHVFVEAIGGTDTAAVIARTALSRGIAFVTANKTLLATEGEHLVALARSTRATLSFEAAVAGGVPVLRVLRDALPHAGVRSIRGVLNGTTNYILTRMKAGAPFVAALAEAQARGFAEADPARDLDGRDAADKIAVLAWQTFGLPPDPAAIQTRGLLPDPDRLIRMAAALDGDVRLLGECFRTPQGIAVTVEPVILDRDSALARTAGEENTVEIATEHTGTIRLSGPGAGGAATASAILSDLRAAATTLPGTRVEGVLAASDTRKLRWALAATDRAFVRETAGRLHVPLSPGSASADAVAVTQPIDRVLAAAFARELELRGAAPLLVRVDDALSGS